MDARERFLLQVGLKPGDVFFEKSDSWLGRAIRWAEQGRGEKESFANHVGIFTGALTVVEALWRVKKHSFTNVEGDVQVWRYLPLGETGQAMVEPEADKFVGDLYGWWKLPAHLFDGLWSKIWKKEEDPDRPYTRRSIARRMLFIDGRPICSYLVARIFEIILEILSRAINRPFPLPFGVSVSAANPDNMHDYVTHSDDWVLVYERIDGVERTPLLDAMDGRR